MLLPVSPYRKAAPKAMLPCEFEGCGQIFSTVQYLNVSTGAQHGFIWTEASSLLPTSTAQDMKTFGFLLFSALTFSPVCLPVPREVQARSPEELPLPSALVWEVLQLQKAPEGT